MSWILRQPKEGLCASATAAAVADKSNARVTISAALAAGVAGWDDSGNARLTPGSLFIGCGQDLFFSGLLRTTTCKGHCAIFCGQLLYLPSSHYTQF